MRCLNLCNRPQGIHFCNRNWILTYRLTTNQVDRPNIDEIKGGVQIHSFCAKTVIFCMQAQPPWVFSFELQKKNWANRVDRPQIAEIKGGLQIQFLSQSLVFGKQASLGIFFQFLENWGLDPPCGRLTPPLTFLVKCLRVPTCQKPGLQLKNCGSATPPLF